MLVGPPARRRPRQADLARAVSTAYYAMFHALAYDCANLMIGGQKADRSKHAWRQVYRSLEHGAAKTACGRAEIGQFPSGIIDFAGNFRALQSKRHSADYDPTCRLTRSEVERDIDIAEESIRKLSLCGAKDRRAFAAFVLFRPPRA